jgi:hypothetical protein
MSTQLNSKLPRFTKILLDFIFGLLIFSSMALVLMIMLSPFILNSAKVPLTASVQVGIGSAEGQRFEAQISGDTTKGIQNAFVDQAQGTLRLETYTWRHIFFSYFGKLLIAIALTYIFYLLRAVMQDILAENPFSPENKVRIQRIGYMVLAIGFVRPTIEYISAKEIMRGLHIEPPMSLPAPFEAEFILFSVLILLLAQVWRIGIELKRDQDLTI